MVDSEKDLKQNFQGDNIPNLLNEQEQIPASSNKASFPLIAGILLIISGIFAILLWISLVFTINVEIITSAVDLTQLQKIDASFTAEKLKDVFVLCGVTFAILALFPILGGILSLKRKLWGIALGCSIIGLSTFLAVIIPGVLCLIALILLVISRNEFQ